MRPYYLYRSKSGIYYVQFFNDITQKRTYPKSTRQRTQAAAMRIACDWLVKGVPSGRGRKPLETVLSVQGMVSLISKGLLDFADLKKITDSLALQGLGLVSTPQEVLPAESVKTGLVAYLENFWNYEKSPYVRDKIIHRQRIGKRHCYDSKNRVKYWKAFFTDAKRIEDVRTEDLKAFEASLAAKKLSAATLNYILQAGKTAFKWAHENKMIAVDPCIGLMRYGKETKKRNVLTEEEVKTLFSVKWNDERSRVASLVAMTCGLRQGEILALRNCDVAENRLFVRHSWSPKDGLKTPKNGETREVPLLPSVRAALKKLSASNPFGWDEERFIFYGTLKEKPVVENVLNVGFKDALAKANVSEEQRVERNIVFHSWRHYYAKVIADRVDQRQAQLALGHMTSAMTEYYADHKTESDLEAIAVAVGDAFKGCL